MAHHQRTDNTLQTLQQGQARHDKMWEEQRQWNYNTTQTLTSIRESQEQEAKDIETLLGFFPLNWTTTTKSSLGEDPRYLR
jgi:hypothetical protein